MEGSGGRPGVESAKREFNAISQDLDIVSRNEIILVHLS